VTAILKPWLRASIGNSAVRIEHVGVTLDLNGEESLPIDETAMEI